MKQKDLIKLLERNGWYKVREGGNHMVYTNGKEIEAIPRHKEIAEILEVSIPRVSQIHGKTIAKLRTLIEEELA